MRGSGGKNLTHPPLDLALVKRLDEQPRHVQALVRQVVHAAQQRALQPRVPLSIVQLRRGGGLRCYLRWRGLLRVLFSPRACGSRGPGSGWKERTPRVGHERGAPNISALLLLAAERKQLLHLESVALDPTASCEQAWGDC